MKIETKWYTGNPPHVGWWRVQVYWGTVPKHTIGDRPERWSWWDGTRWSVSVQPQATAINARNASYCPMAPQHGVVWSHYWPEGARVPRIAPANTTQRVRYNAMLEYMA